MRRADGHKERDGELRGIVPGPVSHVDSHPVQRDARVFPVGGRDGREDGRRDFHAGERRWIQPLEDVRGIQPRCAKDLKRHPGAAADGDVRTLEQAEAGIMKGALEIGHVWRRFDPGETRLVV